MGLEYEPSSELLHISVTQLLTVTSVKVEMYTKSIVNAFNSNVNFHP